MGHATGLGGAHQDLAKRLLRGPVAMVEPRDPAAKQAWREILETLFSPGDAALAARLPVIPTTVADLARRTGMDAAALRARLDAMAGKGLVLDLHDARTGATTYMLAPPVVGFFELSMMRLDDGLPKARLARAYEAYMAGDSAFDEEVSGVPTLVSRTLVQETALFDDLASEVLDWERATSYVEEADCLAVTNCFCRHVATHLGTACDYPLETCMSLGTAARYLDPARPRQADRQRGGTRASRGRARARPRAHRGQRAAGAELHLQLLRVLLRRAPLGSERHARDAAERLPARGRRSPLHGLRQVRAGLPGPGHLARAPSGRSAERRRQGRDTTGQPRRPRPLHRLRRLRRGVP